MIDPIIEKVRQRIEADKLNLSEASAAIGVGIQSLTRHLGGEYVRSDSLAKYRIWLQGGNATRFPQSVDEELKHEEMSKAKPAQLAGLKPSSLIPTRPGYVVDLFCGCGGMSLGFERFQGGKVFQVAMALDIEEPMVRVFNDNHPSSSNELLIGRQGDITEFMNEAEVQAYFLDHLARTTGNQNLATALNKLGRFSVMGLRRSLHELDAQFLEQLTAIRGDASYIAALREAGTATLGQTSVIGFHGATKLPFTNSSSPKFGPLIWHRDGVVSSAPGILDVVPDEALVKACRAKARKLWNSEVRKLTTRAEGSGHGQLASAAERITRFLTFLETQPMQKVRQFWITWRANREAIRITFLDDEVVQTRLRSIYEDGHQISVLLGGPPCQGFSRIGRGKIRSLREQSVHVQEDVDSVDSRNQLMHQYVLFVAALAPKVFLFENVRHFQAVVKSEGVEYDAADILAESIEAVSVSGLGYTVARNIVVASKHAVPQARERFVMAGIRRDLKGPLAGADAAAWCLSLQAREAVPLQVALEGLPQPAFANQDELTSTSIVEVRYSAETQTNTAIAIYRNWVFHSTSVDAHIARPPRPDDSAFFSLMGPGKRWMDYRCDDAPTLSRLSIALTSLCNAIVKEPTIAKKIGVTADEAKELAKITDGSLSLRLLLETIAPVPGELQHHLLTQTYLNKREGAHGDWLSRMNASQPSKTIVSHMAKDTYAFVHPFVPRTLSVREAARVQSFPDNYRFGSVGLVDGFKVVGNAVPPLLSLQFAERVAQVLVLADASRSSTSTKLARSGGSHS